MPASSRSRGSSARGQAGPGQAVRVDGHQRLGDAVAVHVAERLEADRGIEIARIHGERRDLTLVIHLEDQEAGAVRFSPHHEDIGPPIGVQIPARARRVELDRAGAHGDPVLGVRVEDHGDPAAGHHPDRAVLVTRTKEAQRDHRARLHPLHQLELGVAQERDDPLRLRGRLHPCHEQFRVVGELTRGAATSLERGEREQKREGAGEGGHRARTTPKGHLPLPGGT
jgi:hypothetical protein